MSHTSHSGFQDGFLEIVEEQLKLCLQEVRDYDQQIDEKRSEMDGLRVERDAAAMRAEQLRDLLGSNKGAGTAEVSGPLATTRTADADAVVDLIREHGEAMHYIEIHRTLVNRGFEIGGEGKADTLLSRYFKDPRLVRVSRGTYDLAERGKLRVGATEHRGQPGSKLRLPEMPSRPTRGLDSRMPLSKMIEETLRQAGKPLHYRDITERIQKSGKWQTSGRTPEASVNSVMVVDINDNGDQSVFVRNGRGIYGLREWRDDES